MLRTHDDDKPPSNESKTPINRIKYRFRDVKKVLYVEGYGKKINYNFKDAAGSSKVFFPRTRIRI